MIVRAIPRFLTLPIYAFDISDFSYKFLRLDGRSDNMHVAEFGEGDIPPGIIQGGEIKNKAALTDILREAIRRNHIRFVAISLPDEKGFVRFLTMPMATVKKNEIGQALGLQLEEYVPLPPGEVLFDHTLVGEDKDHYDVVLRAMPKSLVNDYCEVITAAGATPVLIEQELGAIAKAVVPRDFIDTGMILDWGKSRTSFAVFHRGIVHFSATISIGGSSLTEEIAKQMKISIADAEQLKKAKAKISLDPESIKNDEIMQMLMPMITVLREEAEKYIQYWQSHSETDVRPSKLLLTGGDVHIPGFAEYLSRELGIAVMLADPWINVRFPGKYIPELSWKDSLRFACVIGLCVKANEDSLMI